MSERKSHVVRVDSLEDDKILVKITVKPYMSLLLLLAVSVYMMIRPDTRMVGIVITIGCLILILFVSDRTIMTAADRYLVIYDPKNKDICTRIYLSEIVTWEYIFNRKTEELVFTLDDGSTISVPLIMKKKLMRYLRDKMDAKEIKHGK